jgi:hypothetical protein
MRMRIDVTTVERSISDVVALVARRLAEPSPRPLAVGSVNRDDLHHSRPGPALLDELGEVDCLLLADVAPIARRGPRLAMQSQPWVTGADLLEPILADCPAAGFEHFQIGRAVPHGSRHTLENANELGFAECDAHNVAPNL